MAISEQGPVVQVLCAFPDEQGVVEVDYAPGMTATQAVERSQLLERYAALLDDDIVLGVWGVQVEADFLVEPGDRVEISRPLEVDPRDMRRELLSDGRVMGGAPAPKLRKKARKARG